MRTDSAASMTSYMSSRQRSCSASYATSSGGQGNLSERYGELLKLENCLERLVRVLRGTDAAWRLPEDIDDELDRAEKLLERLEQGAYK